jgi:PadR family transcriptional regulator, regulatory protein AphA
MDIKYAILGFLSWQPGTGYDLKKLVLEFPGSHWSGNNNQIYTTLVKLHAEGLVSDRIETQERYPSKRIYAITKKGLAELREWLVSAPELPSYRSMFLVQLAWADRLQGGELDRLLEQYEAEVEAQCLMARERQKRRSEPGPARTPREGYIWRMISENNAGKWESELGWVRKLRDGVKNFME